MDGATTNIFLIHSKAVYVEVYIHENELFMDFYINALTSLSNVSDLPYTPYLELHE